MEVLQEILRATEILLYPGRDGSRASRIFAPPNFSNLFNPFNFSTPFLTFLTILNHSNYFQLYP